MLQPKQYWKPPNGPDQSASSEGLQGWFRRSVVSQKLYYISVNFYYTGKGLKITPQMSKCVAIKTGLTQFKTVLQQDPVLQHIHDKVTTQKQKQTQQDVFLIE